MPGCKKNIALILMRPNKRLGDSNQRFSWQTISELVERLYMVLFILLKTLLKDVSATFLLVFFV